MIKENQWNVPDYWDKRYIEKTEQLSKPVYQVSVYENMTIVLEDGTRLLCDVYKPDADGKFPILIGFSPFGKAAQKVGRKRDPIMLGKVMYEQGIEIGGIDYFVSRGYVVVIPNPRGIISSEGKWTGILSEQDQMDCCEVIRWAGSKDFSNGNVGMIGVGYAGKIQPLIAARKPKFLKAIMPVDLVDDMYLDSYPGGILSDINYPLCSYIPSINSISEAELESTSEELKAMLENARNNPEIATNSYFFRGLDSWPPRHYTWNIDVLLHPYQGDFWEKRSAKTIIKDIDIPAYLVSLYYDYGRSTVSAMNIYNDLKDGICKKAMLIEPGFQKCAPYEKSNAEMLRWYDYWLKGIDTGILDEPPIKLYVMGADQFRYEHEWPLKRTEWANMYFRKNGILSFNKENEPQVEPEVLIHIPPTQKSQMPEEIPKLLFATQSFDCDTEMTGPVVARLYASVDAEDANFIIKLWDVNESGYRVLLSTGALKASRKEVNETLSTAFDRCHDHLSDNAVTQGEISLYEFNLAPISNIFNKGHKLEVEFKAMDQQYYDFNECAALPRLYTSGRVMGPHPSATKTFYQLFCNSIHNSHIQVPIIAKTSEEQWIKQY